MEEQIVMTAEAIEEKINSGDADFIAQYMSGQIVVGQPDEEVIADLQEDTPEEDIIPREDLIAEITGHNPNAQEQEDDEDDAISDLEEQLARQADEMNELRRMVQEKEATPAYVAPERITLDDEDDDDLEYASTVAKNNRKLLEELKGQINSTASNPVVEELEAKLARLEAAERQREEKTEAERAKIAQSQAQNKLFDEITKLQNEVDTFRTEKNIKEIYGEFTDFKTRMADFISSTDESAINKAVYSALTGNSDKDRAFRKTIENAGIDIPSDGQTYMQLADVVDLKNGQRYNYQTGEYEDILDEYGNRVNQRSLVDAYRLSDYANSMHNAETNAAKGIQEQLLARQNSATTIPNGMIADPAEQDTVSMQEAEALLGMSSATIMKNPELKKKYDQVMKQFGL